MKSKTARPSAEPYLPPSRRSQPINKEPPPSTSLSNENKKEDGDEEEEEDWEKLLDGNINSPNNGVMEEVKF